MNAVVLSTHMLTIGYPVPRASARIIAAHITIGLHAGDMVCLIGPNGAGKSTLLRTLAGMQKPLVGRVMLAGQDVHQLDPLERARHLSIVLTDRVPYGMLSAYELVALGRHPYTDWSGRLSEQDETVVRWAIQAVGAVELAHRLVSELSDGERQKIMIARALAQEPSLIILDEPTAFLDLPRRVEIMRLLRQLARDTGRAVLLSTHDLDLALRLADSLWLMPGDGQVHSGAPEDLVLNGILGDAFHSDGVTFDLHSGAFVTQTPGGVPIRLTGEGIGEVWARRALERAGYTVTADGDAALAQIEALDVTPPRWRLTRGDTMQDYTALGDLLAAVQLLFA
ncbi:MAG: ABC transporter ATP-binding protein [Anaerolineae bacterium]|nr:ABC transporter ATP-binding protein [Anaerolineae bacterium]